jgi:hypothetical protein
MAYNPATQRIILVGGSGSAGFLSDTWQWDGIAWSQIVPTGSSPSARYYPNIAYDPTSSSIVLFGGAPVQGPFSNETWLLNGSTWSLVPIVPTPAPRQLAAMAYDAAHQSTVLYGGSGNGTIFQDTWTWDGTAWTMKNPSTTPGQVSGGVMAFYPVLNETVLWDGAPINGLGQSYTYLWDGSNWSLHNISSNPPSRYGSPLVYDPVRRTLILFGGHAYSGGVLNDMWEWNGTTWSQITPTVVPPARGGHGLALDTVRNRIVLFGGQGESGTGLNDTWEWSGSNWTNVTPSNPASGPSARDRFGMAYDGMRHQVVMVGDSTYRDSVTWGWNGFVWTPIDTPTKLPTRSDFSMVYDAARKQVVAFGGFVGGPVLGGTWVLGSVAGKLYFQTASGDTLSAWTMNGVSVASYSIIPVSPPGWRLAGTADFDGDGVTDLLFQNTSSGAVTVWFMGGSDGNQFQAYSVLTGGYGPSWKIAAIGNFDNQNGPDVVWQNEDTRQVTVWFLSTGSRQPTLLSWQNLATTPGYHLVAVGNFGGQNSGPDLVWQNDGAPRLTMWFYGRTDRHDVTELGSGAALK